MFWLSDSVLFWLWVKRTNFFSQCKQHKLICTQIYAQKYRIVWNTVAHKKLSTEGSALCRDWEASQLMLNLLRNSNWSGNTWSIDLYWSQEDVFNIFNNFWCKLLFNEKTDQNEPKFVVTWDAESWGVSSHVLKLTMLHVNSADSVSVLSCCRTLWWLKTSYNPMNMSSVLITKL